MWWEAKRKNEREMEGGRARECWIDRYIERKQRESSFLRRSICIKCFLQHTHTHTHFGGVNNVSPFVSWCFFVFFSFTIASCTLELVRQEDPGWAGLSWSFSPWLPLLLKNRHVCMRVAWQHVRRAYSSSPSPVVSSFSRTADACTNSCIFGVPAFVQLVPGSACIPDMLLFFTLQCKPSLHSNHFVLPISISIQFYFIWIVFFLTADAR